MKHFVLIPDSFKGTMSSMEICEIMAAQIKSVYPDATTDAIPVADGGEGSVDAFLQALGGERLTATVSGPFFDPVESFYGLIDEGKTGVVEMAAAAGLPMVGDRRDPRITTSYGVGELILEAAKSGANRIIVGLGGSSTNDGGCGAAAAAGIRFLNKAGEAFVPTGGTLIDIDAIDASGYAPELAEVDIIAMCDIDNPLTGETGAAHVFGPQKGADPEMVKELDAGLVHLAKIVARDLGIDVDKTPGAGAAGGLGAGMKVFFRAELQMGIETVLDTVGFDQRIKDADLILTGEGKIDTQSLRGKVVIGVANRAKKSNRPVVAIVGDIGDDIEAAYDHGVTGIISINRVAVDFSKARPRAKQDMALTINNLMRMFRGMGL